MISFSYLIKHYYFMVNYYNYFITYPIYTTTARHTPGGSIHGIQPLSGHIPIFFNYIHNHIHILLADFFTLRFHHNTHHRLCSELTDQDSSGITQFLCNLLHSCLYICVILRSLLVGHSHVCEHLRTIAKP